MTAADWVLLAVGFALILGTGFFVSSEFALVTLDRADLEARRDRGERMLGAPIAALKRTSTHLSSAQLGITLTTLITGFTLEPTLSKLIEPGLASWGLPLGAVAPIATFLGLLIATVTSMIIGELVPKYLAIAEPRGVGRVVLPILLGFSWLFRPFVSLINATANRLLRLVGIEPREELSSARTAEELRSLVRRSASQGTLESDTATLLARTLGFSELTAADVMTPRTRLEYVERAETANDVIDLARRTGYSRFPVTGEDVDDVVGVVHVKQAVAVPRERRDRVPASALQSDALRVPETMRLDSLLGELRAHGYQLAIVVDEYGGTSGIATLEDLVEELVGELADEHDRTRADVVRARNWLTFPGMLRPDELAERAGVIVPEDGPYETVAGYLLERLGRLAVVGDEVEVEAGTFRVERLDGRRIDRVRFTPTPEADRSPSALRQAQEPRSETKRGEA